MSACATAAAPHVPAEARRPTRAVAIADARREPPLACNGIEVELVVRDRSAGKSRSALLRCKARGATLTYADDPVEHEESVQTIELARDEASALWDALRGMSIDDLECGGGPGARAHRLQITGAHGAPRVAVCDAAATPKAWRALEALFEEAWRARSEDVVWPFDAGNWDGELG
jgi:hypothetical protein